MNTKRFVFVVLACLLSFAVAAQDAPQIQLMLVYDEAVKPGKVDAYVENSKEFFAMLVDHVPQAEWSAVMRDDMHFLYAIPLSSHADIDAMHATMMEMMMSADAGTMMAMMESAGETLDHTDALIVGRRDDLSYHPETMVPPDEVKVLEYNFYYLKPGMEFAAENLAKEYAATMKKKGVPHGWTFYQLLLGADMPALAVIVPARSAEELTKMNAEVMEKMGAEGKALDARAMDMIRRFDRKIGWVRPDLSSGAFRKASQ